MANYFTRGRRDKRFDGLVNRAIKDNKPLADSDVIKLTGRYSDRLLQTRGEMIARTETLQAVNTGQFEAFNQAIDAGAVAKKDIKKVWISAGDNRTRDSHAEINGVAVGIDERFPNGLLYPLDPAGDASEIINCRCILDYDVDFIGAAV
jgi:uncharacterized protein with gpF-like domain